MLNSLFLFIHFELTLHNKESVAARGDPWACGGRSEGGPPPLHPASSLPPSITSRCRHLTAMIKMHFEVAFTLRVVVCNDWEIEVTEVYDTFMMSCGVGLLGHWQQRNCYSRVFSDTRRPQLGFHGVVQNIAHVPAAVLMLVSRLHNHLT